MNATPDPVAEARGWLEDLAWADEPDIASLSPEQVRSAVGRHYAGGWDQFLRDGDSTEEPAVIAADILGSYTAGWSDADVREALSGISNVTLYRPAGGQS